MKRTVRRAARGDLPIIMRLIEDGKAIMRRNGNMLQWSDGYPQKELLLRDIDRGQSFLLMDHEGTDSRAIATWAFIPGPDVTYNEIERGERSTMSHLIMSFIGWPVVRIVIMCWPTSWLIASL